MNRSGHSTYFSGRMGSHSFKALVVAAMVSAVTVAAQAPVNLGAAGDFFILAKTGISTTGSTHVHGDIGVSPSAATAITGFDLIADPSGTFSTTTLVVGRVYAADYTDPTPTLMTAAISDMETAYTDAAGRTTPDYTELYTGDLTGQTLTPGLYKWGTNVLVSPGGVTISGSPTDIWIFQIAGNLTVSNGAIVTLAGGAQAKNIFWQVAGQITIGTTAQMAGILLCQTLIDMQTGSTLNGRALSQTAVTTNASSVLLPDPTTLSFTSARTAFATGGNPFAYAITYHNPGDSADLRDTVLSRPSWVVIQNDSIRGDAPNVNRADTVKMVISSGTESDTLTLVIRIAYAASVANGFSARGGENFGRIKGNRIGVDAGAYDVSMYTLTGRGIYRSKTNASPGFVNLDLTPNAGNMFVVKLTQGDRSTVNTVHVVR